MLFNLEEISSFDIMMIIITMENNMGGGGEGSFLSSNFESDIFFQFRIRIFFFFLRRFFSKIQKGIVVKSIEKL